MKLKKLYINYHKNPNKIRSSGSAKLYSKESCPFVSSALVDIYIISMYLNVRPFAVLNFILPKMSLFLYPYMPHVHVHMSIIGKSSLIKSFSMSFSNMKIGLFLFEYMLDHLYIFEVVLCLCIFQFL